MLLKAELANSGHPNDETEIMGFTGVTSADRWVVRLSDYRHGDFEVFRHAEATQCTDGVKFGAESVPNFTPSVRR